MPEPADSIQHLLGTSFSSNFPGELLECRVFVDGVVMRYGATQPGVRLSGWGWHGQESKPFDLVVAIDAAETILGATDVGTDRSDVMAAFPVLTQPFVGFELDVPVDAGPVTLRGVDLDTGSACEIATNFDVSEVEAPE